MKKLERPFRLLYVIIRHGKWRHSGIDFNEDRKQVLQGLQAFVPSVPAKLHIPFWNKVRNVLLKNTFARNLLTQLAHLKSGLTPHGGHVHLPFLNISYIRIPKAASTSLSLMMLREIYPGLKAVPLTATEVNYLTDANLRIQVSPADPLDVFFAVVRNPFARIVSVYRDFYQRRDVPFIYEDYLFGILPRHLSFADFVKRVSLIPNFLKDQHLKPQHEFLDFYVRKIPTVLVLKLEEPDQLKAFCAIYNLDLPHINTSGGSYDYRTYYDYETFQLVTSIYRKDFKRFNYGSEVRALRTWLRRRERPEK